MPYRFDLEINRSVLCCTFTGLVTDDELRQFHKDAARMVQRINPSAAIINFSAITGLEVSGGAIRSLARGDPVMPDMERPRFIVAPPGHVYGMARMYQMVGETTRPRLQVLRTMQEALSAIGLEQPSFQKIPEE